MATPTGADIVAAVRKHLGAPYVYGAEGPNAFDCSGLVQYALGGLGVKNVPRTSEAQWGWSKFSSVSYADLQEGDLIFSDWPGDGTTPGHVAIYSGHNKLIEAPRTGVPVHEIELNSYYRNHVKGYKRLSGAAAGTSSATGSTSSSDSSGIGSGLLGIGTELANASKFVSLLLMPQTWLRVTAFLIGAGAVGTGLWLLIEEAGTQHG
jgi:hypothetical protein